MASAAASWSITECEPGDDHQKKRTHILTNLLIVTIRNNCKAHSW